MFELSSVVTTLLFMYYLPSACAGSQNTLEEPFHIDTLESWGVDSGASEISIPMNEKYVRSNSNPSHHSYAFSDRTCEFPPEFLERHPSNDSLIFCYHFCAVFKIFQEKF